MDARRPLLACTLALACVSRPLSTGDDGQAESTSETDSGSSSSESSSSDSTTESTESSSGSDDQSDFVPLVDFPPDRSCDSFLQDCPDGEKCVFYASTGGTWDATKCVPVMGDQAVGDACNYDGAVEGTDDCDASSMCWDVMEADRELVGTCVPFCGGTADAPTCPPGFVCQFSGQDVPAWCDELCDPLLQDCADGFACFFAAPNFNCIFTTQDIPEGEPCGYINDCAAGNYCEVAAKLPSCAGAACCASFCDLDLGLGQCTIVGTECVGFFEVGTAPPGYENVGYCILPG